MPSSFHPWWKGSYEAFIQQRTWRGLPKLHPDPSPRNGRKLGLRFIVSPSVLYLHTLSTEPNKADKLWAEAWGTLEALCVSLDVGESSPLWSFMRKCWQLLSWHHCLCCTDLSGYSEEKDAKQSKFFLLECSNLYLTMGF